MPFLVAGRLAGVGGRVDSIQEELKHSVVADLFVVVVERLPLRSSVHWVQVEPLAVALQSLRFVHKGQFLAKVHCTLLLPVVQEHFARLVAVLAMAADSVVLDGSTAGSANILGVLEEDIQQGFVSGLRKTLALVPEHVVNFHFDIAHLLASADDIQNDACIAAAEPEMKSLDIRGWIGKPDLLSSQPDDLYSALAYPLHAETGFVQGILNTSQHLVLVVVAVVDELLGDVAVESAAD